MTVMSSGIVWDAVSDDGYYHGLPHTITLKDGDEHTIKMPDGTIIEVAKDGSFKILDKDAKVTYRASRIHDFNTFINASDKLEAFIKYCADQSVRKEEMLELPLKLFIGWLCLEAAKADREPEPDIKLLPDLRRLAVPRCHGCGKFISPAMRAKHIEFCQPACFDLHYCRSFPDRIEHGREGRART